MSPDAAVQQEDLDLRRQLLRQAIERAWEVDVAERPPSGGFRLERELATSTSTPPNSKFKIQNSKAGELAAAYRSGERSPSEVTARALDQAEATQPSLNAFITILRESALEQAGASEQRWRRGEPLSPLDGVPVAVKDLAHIAGVRTTSASRIMSDFIATEDAPVIRRLKAAGAVIIGKTNLHEFAYGSTGDVSAYGPSHNPRNLEHMTGGSSSGSAAAVAGGICPIALGTDTACSIRIPAAFCGIAGLKATYGLVPSAGVIPLSWSLDHVGPLAATVADAALALAVLADFEVPDFDARAGRPMIGVCRDLFFEHLDSDVRTRVEAAIAELGEVREVQIPHIRTAGPAQAMITAAEARAFHRRWLETRAAEYDWSLRNRLEAALEVSAPDYVQACRLRGLLVEEMAAALAGVDVLAMPTGAVPAPKIGQRQIEVEDGSVDVFAILVRNTGPINFTGFPAISVPCGETSGGLPVGLQLVTRPWEEARLLQIAYSFENR